MNEEYLWNRSGEHDPEIARLEETLRPLRYEPNVSRLQLPARQTATRKPRLWIWSAAVPLAIAATLAIILVRPHSSNTSSWKISWSNSGSEMLRAGQLVETRSATARLESDFVGEVNVGPQSRLRILASTQDQQRFALERGTIHAFIWAPPKEFVVDTPAASTIDLGCQYTLDVSPNGAGVLQVETGWVAFQWKNLESFIPAGAECHTRPERGPGLPYFRDASAELQVAVGRFDSSADSSALQTILSNARPQDGLTLWHLLPRTQGPQRAEVFDRFQELVKLPTSVTKEKILKSDSSALDAAWNALNLGNTDWWREWKRRW